MKILVACEESQRVCTEFRRLGHEAYSCDIEPCSGGHPEWHIQADVLPLLDGGCSFCTMDGMGHHISGKWDMVIAFPPCTYLTSVGNRWFNVVPASQGRCSAVGRHCPSGIQTVGVGAAGKGGQIPFPCCQCHDTAFPIPHPLGLCR